MNRPTILMKNLMTVIAIQFQVLKWMFLWHRWKAECWNANVGMHHWYIWWTPAKYFNWKNCKDYSNIHLEMTCNKWESKYYIPGSAIWSTSERRNNTLVIFLQIHGQVYFWRYCHSDQHLCSLQRKRNTLHKCWWNRNLHWHACPHVSCKDAIIPTLLGKGHPIWACGKCYVLKLIW